MHNGFPSPQEDGLSEFETFLKRLTSKKVGMKPLHLSILLHLWRRREGLGAYDLLSQLNASGDGVKPLAPQTLYRALHHLVGEGILVKVASRNLYVLCAHPEHPHMCIFLICQICGQTQECEDPSLEERLLVLSKKQHFHPLHPILEIAGQCARCRPSAHGV